MGQKYFVDVSGWRSSLVYYFDDTPYGNLMNHMHVKGASNMVNVLNFNGKILGSTYHSLLALTIL